MNSKSLLLVSVTLCACVTNPDGYDRPARIVDPDAASRAALRGALFESLGVAVTISDSALTDSSLLVIENRPPATMEDQVPQGRIMEMPIRLRLVKNGNDCVLVNQRDRTRYVLADTACAIESD